MTNTIPKFGELALKSDENDEIQNGFSNIDLNSTAQNGNLDHNETDLGYTSFGINSNEQNNLNQNNSIPTNSTVMHLDGSTFNEPTSPVNTSIINTKSFNTSNSYNNSNNNNNNNSQSYMFPSATEASTKLAIKFENLKQWSISAYKCTRQIVSEKLGKSSRTIDPELEASIDNLREVKRKYESVLSLASSLSSHFRNVVKTQKLLGETFAELAQKSSELIDEFTSNSETQRQLVKQGELLLNGLDLFTSSLKTLCTKTMEDTLLTIRNYEAARLEYDAYRFDLETLKSAPQNEQKLHEISNLEQNVFNFREKYEHLKKDVVIKIKFLDENRIKVMKKQLVLFQAAINSYFTGNKEALESSIKRLNLNTNNDKHLTSNPDDGSFKFQSFLEKN